MHVSVKDFGSLLVSFCVGGRGFSWVTFVLRRVCVFLLSLLQLTHPQDVSFYWFVLDLPNPPLSEHNASPLDNTEAIIRATSTGGFWAPVDFHVLTTLRRGPFLFAEIQSVPNL